MAARFRFRLRQLAHDLTGGMLLVPAAMTVALAAVGLALIELEAHEALPRWAGGGWFFRNDPGSALAVLGAIAGSMMAVVSIVYSVLLVALSLASVQFSPRILGGFVRDPVSQRTLGVFLGTFVYCLLVMRATTTDPAWVPTWAVAVGCLLGLACLVFLIYFLHHIATGIQVNNLVDRIAHETSEVIDDVYRAEAAVAVPALGEATAVTSTGEGYLQLVDHDGLIAIARDHGVTVHVAVEPGDYVPRGAAVARLVGGDASPAVLAACRDAFDLGPVRTMQPDVGFGVRQLVDVALKAISPAVNDPSTACTCIDRLGSLLAAIAPRRCGARVLADGGVARVVIPQPTFAQLADLAFNQLRQYGRTDLAVSIRLLRAIEVAARPASAAQRAHLRRHAELVRDGLSPDFLAADRQRFDAHLEGVLAQLG
ncbi:MAG: DUF2254 domain-containing protein [Deltaproteobacteria bacterium]|nr:DUF2254 domain-containing protein [Deltaproteobacteria bacterium]